KLNGVVVDTVPEADLSRPSRRNKDQSFSAELTTGEILEVNPRKGTETRSKGDDVTVKYGERGERKEYTVKYKKDEKGNLGPVEIKNDRGTWKFEYKPPDSKNPADISVFIGPDGKKFTKGENATGFEVSPTGDVTVNLKGDKQHKSVT